MGVGKRLVDAEIFFPALKSVKFRIGGFGHENLVVFVSIFQLLEYTSAWSDGEQRTF